MSDEEQSKLFNRYYRGTNTKEKPEGSGFGLAIAKQIIALHGGDIDVKSKLGEGICFTIIFLGEIHNWLSEVVNFVVATHLMGQKRCRGWPRLLDNLLLLILFLLPPVIAAGGFLVFFFRRQRRMKFDGGEKLR